MTYLDVQILEVLLSVWFSLYFKMLYVGTNHRMHMCTQSKDRNIAFIVLLCFYVCFIENVTVVLNLFYKRIIWILKLNHYLIACSCCFSEASPPLHPMSLHLCLLLPHFQLHTPLLVATGCQQLGTLWPPRNPELDSCLTIGNSLTNLVEKINS